ncbi:Centrosomal protein of 57 kDa, partial [Nibea albiflora]
MLPIPRKLEFAAHPSTSTDPEMSSPQTNPNIDSRAVVDALKTLQQKIRRLELERKQAERSFRQYSHDTPKNQQVTASSSMPRQPAASLPESDNSGRKELDSKLQSTEARCKVLEKQLDYMRKMVENAKKERNAIMEDQASLQNQQPSSSNTQSQREKLEKLESECLKLSRTQTLAEMKLAILEQKLLKEEHERQLVQEKADQLQKELDINFRLSVSSSEEKPKKKTKKTTKRASGVDGSDRCNPTSRAEERSAERTGEVGYQDGGEGSSDHEAPQTPADSVHKLTQSQPDEHTAQKLSGIKPPAPSPV